MPRPSKYSPRTIDRLRSVRMPFNVDMMFGLPHQTVESVTRDIAQLTALRVPTITIYRLRNVDHQMLGIGVLAAWNIPNVKMRLEQASAFPALEDTYAMRRGAVAVRFRARSGSPTAMCS